MGSLREVPRVKVLLILETRLLKEAESVGMTPPSQLYAQEYSEMALAIMAGCL